MLEREEAKMPPFFGVSLSFLLFSSRTWLAWIECFLFCDGAIL